MMNHEIKLSVLIVTYNHRQYIQQALNSVLAQKTNFKIEVLVGDDHSDDGTTELLCQAAQENDCIVPVLRSDNIGATNNLCDLQMRAKGMFVAYLDGDDYWDDPEKLQKQVSFLETHNEYIACTHRCHLVNENGCLQKSQQLRWISEKSKFSIKDFEGIILPGHLSTLVHRNTFVDEKDLVRTIMTLHPVVGDRSLFLYLLSKGDIFNLPDRMSCYRQRNDATGSNATAHVYGKNPDRVREDYIYTKRLEHCADELLHVDGGFIIHKRNIFAGAVWMAVRDPSKRTFAVLIDMLREGPVLDYLFHFPMQIFIKIRDRIYR